ncbi:hypothetical protein P692DRAFT_20819337 [Suillus brevipes Sb2]|nr:hypothetical protein P692DRAFT_20819337 [Suillus brevipes Sb2]
MSSDPDFDDLNGYQADTSINTNDFTCSSTPVMTLSDDLLSNPASTKDNPSSVTELESDVEDPPPVPPPKDDLSSITKPENTPIKTSIKGATTTPKKSFFNTPSPPGPDSLYWKNVSQDEDAKWYDRNRSEF